VGEVACDCHLERVERELQIPYSDCHEGQVVPHVRSVLLLGQLERTQESLEAEVLLIGLEAGNPDIALDLPGFDA